jgi:hypothetical protein
MSEAWEKTPNILARKQARDKFQKFKRRAKRRLPSMVIKFYEWKLKNSPNDWDIESIERTLGRIISALSNPFYSIRDGAKVLSYDAEIADQILLELGMEEFCKFVYQKVGK